MSEPLLRIASGIVAFILFSVSIAAADAPVLQLAQTYTDSQDVAGWLMSEKLDGIRGYWTGEKLLTRKGRTIHAPEWFTKVLPPFALDGELWRGRNDFAFVQNTVMDGVPSADWEEITYNIFEVPGACGDFPTRLDRARAWFKAHPAHHVNIIEQRVCNGPDHLNAFLSEIESNGGEGVIIRDPALPFHSGRSPHILKVKHFQDMEATVIAHNPGKGRLRGAMGSLTVRLENGTEFRLGSGFSDEQRMDPPAIGQTVTFRYQGFTRNGIPRFASFLRVRKD